MWTYEQSTGRMIAADGEVIAVGYAGLGEHKNRPESERLKNHGPLPRGLYLIGKPYATQAHGPYVMRLTPDGANQMYGRGSFLIHGDSVKRPGTASNGCIILPKVARVRVWESGDRELEVIA